LDDAAAAILNEQSKLAWAVGAHAFEVRSACALIDQDDAVPWRHVREGVSEVGAQILGAPEAPGTSHNHERPTAEEAARTEPATQLAEHLSPVARAPPFGLEAHLFGEPAPHGVLGGHAGAQRCHRLFDEEEVIAPG
jgi:hypothetical protein